MSLKDLSFSIKPNKPPEEDDPLTSNLAYGRLVGAVCGALVAVVLVSLVSASTLPAAALIFAALVFIGRSLGSLFAAGRLRNTAVIEDDHAAALQRILKKLVPEEHVFEATNIILRKNPDALLLRDPV